MGKDVERQEPALALDAVEGRIPFHGFADVGHVADVGWDGSIAIRFGDLGIAAGEEEDLAVLGDFDWIGRVFFTGGISSG